LLARKRLRDCSSRHREDHQARYYEPRRHQSQRQALQRPNDQAQRTGPLGDWLSNFPASHRSGLSSAKTPG